jgi:cellobiose phosphorylase
VSRKFRNATFEISITNPNHVCKGVKKLVLDGKEIAGNIIPVLDDGKVHNIEVVMG